MWQKAKSWILGKPASAPSPRTENRIALVRDEGYLAACKHWQIQGHADAWIDRLRNAFNLYRAGLEGETCLDFLEFRASNGFAIHLQNEDFPAGESPFVMDLLRDRLLAQDYRLVISDRRIREDSMVDKHYLKPRLERQQQGPVHQRYGNITIELTHRRGEPVRLTLIATHYQDSHYHPPEDFRDLLERLFA